MAKGMQLFVKQLIRTGFILQEKQQKNGLCQMVEEFKELSAISDGTFAAAEHIPLLQPERFLSLISGGLY